MQQIYWDGLDDLPIEGVAAAADVLAKSSQWFPKVAEWREAARTHQLEGLLRLPPGRDDEWKNECEACEDTGWQTKTCDPTTTPTCGRPVRGAHQHAHTYAVPCPCRATNRTYQRHHRVPKGREPRHG